MKIYYPNSWTKIDRDVAHCLTCFHFPQQHRKRIRTTNLLERLNREIKRRADVVQIFPNEEACERLIGALCMEWSEEWIAGRRYLDMTNLKQKSLTPISRSYLFTELFGLDPIWNILKVMLKYNSMQDGKNITVQLSTSYLTRTVIQCRVTDEKR